MTDPTRISDDQHNNAPAVPLGYINAGHLHEMQSGRLPYAYLYAAPGVGVEVPVYAPAPAPAVPQGWKLVQTPITEEMHVAAVKVLHRAPGLAGLPQRMLDAMLAATPAPAPAQEPAKETFQSRHEREFMERMAGNHGKLTEFCAALESFTHDYQRLYSTYKSYRDMISDLIKERDSLRDQVAKPAQEVGLTDRQFDLICQAIDKADTVTMDGDYMLDSDDCIGVVRVMQVLFDISALHAKEQA